MKRYILILLLFSLLSCEKTITHDYCKLKLEEVLEVDIPDDFTIVQSQIQEAFGDYNEMFAIRFPDTTFNLILSKLDKEKLKYYQNESIVEFSEKLDERVEIRITFLCRKNIISYNFTKE